MATGSILWQQKLMKIPLEGSTSSFNGKLLYRPPRDHRSHVYEFLWRPRPPSFLTAEKEEEIAKNLKIYRKK
ncbi:hypothetical protein C5167_000202 [Papaver somniferum]|uniref:Uncharacterized protein n=1 Tax=Papaver somniferum TaxID=3469 RepID=A0A4Y7KV28_PAPSO|nr:hypothetical protein C5167_000202 [Papaver somniferum]